jgi:hypothetical protein
VTRPSSDGPVPRNYRNRFGFSGFADVLYNPVVGRWRKLDCYFRVFAALRVLGRVRAIEHEPDLSIGIREAPGDSDQALPRFTCPPGDRVSVSRRQPFEGSGVESVVAVDQPDFGVGKRFWGIGGRWTRNVIARSSRGSRRVRPEVLLVARETGFGCRWPAHRRSNSLVRRI